VIRPVAEIWQTAGDLCGQRLKAAIPHWLPWLKRRMAVPPALEAQLRRISARQMDRRLQERKHRVKRRLYGTTRPGALLKHQIPIKTDHWDVQQVGYLEIDLVSHSGASAAGEFLHTLDCVDIQTTWVERQDFMGKSRHEVVQAMTMIESQLPFSLRGVDSDNGSEFINDHLLAWCQKRPAGRQVQFTRSRPCKKDDNAHVEQKTWPHVRKLVGWERYDTGRGARRAQRAVCGSALLPESLPALDETRPQGSGGHTADSSVRSAANAVGADPGLWAGGPTPAGRVAAGAQDD
jgi:hypothetical protein